MTRIFADEVGHKVKIVSGVYTEGSFEAVDHALAGKGVGADAILLMPPHHWLRFDCDSRTAVGFFEDVAEGADLPIIVHQYGKDARAHRDHVWPEKRERRASLTSFDRILCSFIASKIVQCRCRML